MPHYSQWRDAKPDARILPYNEGAWSGVKEKILHPIGGARNKTHIVMKWIKRAVEVKMALLKIINAGIS